jgi:hypothetical protein
MRVIVNEEQSKKIGNYFRRRKRNLDEYYKFGDIKGDEENPPLSYGIETIANYYGAVANIDHHFWRLDNGKMILDYGLINGQKIKGATYLHIKSRQMLDKNPHFFDPENLRKLSEKLYEEWLKDETGVIPIYDPDKVRLRLTRNFGEMLSIHYKGNFLELYERSKHRLIDNGNGFLERCEIFDGYRDPYLFKKANLVAKIMERRGLWKFEDPENKIPPIDYHLQNVAIKSGIVKIISKELKKKIKNKEFLTLDEELELRMACKEAYKIIYDISGIDPYYLDDDIWYEGRKYCQFEPPNCEGAFLSPICLANNSNPKLKNYSQPLVETWRY